MLKRSLLLVSVLIFILFKGQLLAQNISNEGTDFWSVFPTHVPSGATLGQIAIFVTSKSNSEVTVSCGAYTETKAIPANTAVRFDVPRENAQVYKNEANQNLINRGIHIKVTDGQAKVSAYTHIYGKFRSAASLILPFETLGQTYFSMNYTQSSGGDNFLALVGVEPNTKLKLHENNGNVINITLQNPGDVYEYMARGRQDLTGVFVETDAETSSCKRFAAFSGSSVIQIACAGATSASVDPLFQQLYPTVSWGKNYGVVPFKDRRYIVRIMAQEDNTNVTYNGQNYVVNKGKFIESAELSTSTFITADKLISVSQYSLTQACSSANGNLIMGDPDMVMLNPIEFNIEGVTVFSSSLEEITNKYLNVLIRTDKLTSFKINGVAPSINWTTMVGNPLYSFAQILVNDASLTLTADAGFNAIAYGFGNAESYAYSAGTNLSSNNYLTVVDEEKNEESPNGCIGTQVDFKVNLTYQPDKIVWTLGTETPDVVSNPIPEIKVINGQTLYVYRYGAGKIFDEIGGYNLKVDAHVPTNASDCISGDLTTNYTFNIFALPTAKFDRPDSTCQNAEVLFADQSIANEPNASVTNWLWDFKDGTTSTEQNPKHIFVLPGIYNVSLIAKTTLGCYSDAVSKTITVNPVPVASFLANDTTCINTNVIFTDQSTIDTVAIPTSKIKNWHWEFGDGTKEDRPDGAPFPHQYNIGGTYIIKLTTTSEEGCVSAIFSKNIVVTALPQADFTMPDICLTDGTATFVNTSKDEDGTIAGLKYLWNFGDNQITGNSSNISTAVNGVHTYTKAENYTVTLTITNENGCISSKTQTFTVNGSNPVASFDVLDSISNTFCGNTPIIIKNTSSVDFGRITKLEVYKDYDNDPTNVEVFTRPVPEEILLNYQPFGTPAEKNYKVRLKVYSGVVCSDFIEKSVVVKASPILTFANISPICENDGQVLINQASETSGIPGSGFYASDTRGTAIDGTFSPKVAGVGMHNITYTFNADNGCNSSITSTITVNPSPTIDAGETLYILDGGEITIPAVARGNNLIYSWSPIAGLSNPNVLNPVAAPAKDTQYSLIVTSNGGCTAISNVTVKVLESLSLPNTFTPNGDGINDVWNIKYLDTYPNATVEIFNRNGSRVFFSNAYKQPFDGTYMNQQLPAGVYYYLISPRNGRKNISGPLTIIR